MPWATWQMEQDLGSCVFTVVYFIVYFVLHGPTLRLLVIGLIVLVQFSFQVFINRSTSSLDLHSLACSAQAASSTCSYFLVLC